MKIQDKNLKTQLQKCHFAHAVEVKLNELKCYNQLIYVVSRLVEF